MGDTLGVTDRVMTDSKEVYLCKNIIHEQNDGTTGEVLLLAYIVVIAIVADVCESAQ